MKYLEILTFKLAIWFIRIGWGTCETMDYEEDGTFPHELNAYGRCGACRATEVINFLKETIELSKGGW